MASEGEWPDDLASRADPFREKLMEAVAESDDALIEKYLEQGELDEKEIVHGVKEGFAAARIAPVLCGAATKPIGVDRLLQFIVEEFPAPSGAHARSPSTAKGGEEQAARHRRRSAAHRLRLQDRLGPVRRAHHDVPCLLGQASPRLDASTTRPRAPRSVSDSSSPCVGKEHETIAEVPAGDIGAVAKLSHTTTGDTFSTKDDPVQLPPLEVPEPLLAFAIVPKTKGDEDKLSTALARLREEDPTFRVERSDETHETVMYGMGEAHLDVMTERMKRKFGVEVSTSPAKIAYRETIRTSGKGLGRHVKQTGGHGQYAVCNIEIEPLPRGGGFEFVDKIFGGAIPNQFIASVEKGIVKTMQQGASQRVPDGRRPVHARRREVPPRRLLGHGLPDRRLSRAEGGRSTRRASCCSSRSSRSRSIVPETYTGDIMGDLNSKRAKIAGMESAGAGKQRVKALVPQAEVARYSIDLRSMTGGRGAFAMRFSHYEEVPSHLADKIITEANKAKEEAQKK